MNKWGRWGYAVLYNVDQGQVWRYLSRDWTKCGWSLVHIWGKYLWAEGGVGFRTLKLEHAWGKTSRILFVTQVKWKREMRNVMWKQQTVGWSFSRGTTLPSRGILEIYRAFCCLQPSGMHPGPQRLSKSMQAWIVWRQSISVCSPS